MVARIGLGPVGNEGFSTEGLIWREWKPAGAINVNRADVLLAKKARGGETFKFQLEAAANPSAHANRYRLPAHSPNELLFVLDRAELACLNQEALDLFCDFQLAAETMFLLPEGTPRRGQLLYALNDSANKFDPIDSESAGPARAALRGVLSKHNGDTAHEISAIGHAHIDTAWLWPLRETIRKCVDERVLPHHFRGDQKSGAARTMGTGRLDVDRSGLQSFLGRITHPADSTREEFLPR